LCSSFACLVSVAGCNNQQLKLLVLKYYLCFLFPAHHNLNNQQLKLVAAEHGAKVLKIGICCEVSVAGCLGYDVLDKKNLNPKNSYLFQLLVV
jgi:hypothetical protein